MAEPCGEGVEVMDEKVIAEGGPVLCFIRFCSVPHVRSGLSSDPQLSAFACCSSSC